MQSEWILIRIHLLKSTYTTLRNLAPLQPFDKRRACYDDDHFASSALHTHFTSSPHSWLHIYIYIYIHIYIKCYSHILPIYVTADIVYVTRVSSCIFVLWKYPRWSETCRDAITTPMSLEWHTLQLSGHQPPDICEFINILNLIKNISRKSGKMHDIFCMIYYTMCKLSLELNLDFMIESYSYIDPKFSIPNGCTEV